MASSSSAGPTIDPWGDGADADQGRPGDPTYQQIYSLATPKGRARVHAQVIGDPSSTTSETFAYAGVQRDRFPNIRRAAREGHESDDEDHPCHRIIADNLGDIQIEASVMKRYIFGSMNIRVAQLLTITEHEIELLGIEGRTAELRQLLGFDTDEPEQMTSKERATQYINRALKAFNRDIHPDKTSAILSALGINDQRFKEGYEELTSIAFVRVRMAMEVYGEICATIIDKRRGPQAPTISFRWMATENIYKFAGMVRGDYNLSSSYTYAPQATRMRYVDPWEAPAAKCFSG